MNQEAREILIGFYLDYTNNYLTYDTFAEHNGLTEIEAMKLIELGSMAHSHPHPEA